MLKSHIFRRLALMLALPAAAAAGLSTTAEANVRKVKHGSACNFGGFYQGASLPPVSINLDIWSYIHQDVTGAWMESNRVEDIVSEVTCSIDRDLPLSTAGFSDIELRFIPIRTTASRQANCDVYSLRSDGTVVDGAGLLKQVPAWIPAGLNPATVMDFNDAIGATASKGATVVSCYLLSGVALTSVYSSENDGIDGN